MQIQIRIRIRIQLLVKVIQPSTAPFGSFSQLQGPPWLLNYEFEASEFGSAFNADPNPAFYSDADPASYNDADPDPHQ